MFTVLMPLECLHTEEVLWVLITGSLQKWIWMQLDLTGYPKNLYESIIIASQLMMLSTDATLGRPDRVWMTKLLHFLLPLLSIIFWPKEF